MGRVDAVYMKMSQKFVVHLARIIDAAKYFLPCSSELMVTELCIHDLISAAACCSAHHPILFTLLITIAQWQEEPSSAADTDLKRGRCHRQQMQRFMRLLMWSAMANSHDPAGALPALSSPMRIL